MSNSWILPVSLVAVVLLALCTWRVLRAEEGSGALKLYEERSFVYTGGIYKEHKFPYRLLFPADYAEKKPENKVEKKWPLILFLHGAGERGADNKAQLKYFPTDMASRENRAKFPTFLVAPQCPAERAWSAASLRDVSAKFNPEPCDETKALMGMLEGLLKELPVDPSRVYLTGLSMGGYGSWDLAARYPTKWAAVVPICGGGDPATAPRFKDLPLWAFHGGKDPVVPPARSHVMIDALKAAGGSPRYTEFPDAGHDSWTPGYRHPEFLPWLFSQKRAPAEGAGASSAGPAGAAPSAVAIQGERIVLGASLAQATGGVKLDDGALGSWTDPAGQASWRIESPGAAQVDVSVVFSSTKDSAGAELEVVCGDSRASGKTIETDGFLTLPLGLISVPEGRSQIVVRAVPKPGQSAMKLREIVLEKGFASLFDGKSLEGWEGSVNGYKAADGMLTCIPSSGGNLYTRKEYGDFSFRFEFRLERRANNGLGIRAPRGCDAAYCGFEIQILDDPRYEGEIQPYQRHGSVYDLVPAKPGFLRPVGDWNTEEVIAKGTHIQVLLNGTTIVDADMAEVKARLDAGHLERHKDGLAREKGYILFCGHGTKVDFRDIRVKELTK